MKYLSIGLALAMANAAQAGNHGGTQQSFRSHYRAPRVVIVQQAPLYSGYPGGCYGGCGGGVQTYAPQQAPLQYAPQCAPQQVPQQAPQMAPACDTCNGGGGGGVETFAPQQSYGYQQQQTGYAAGFAAPAYQQSYGVQQSFTPSYNYAQRGIGVGFSTGYTGYGVQQQVFRQRALFRRPGVVFQQQVGYGVVAGGVNVNINNTRRGLFGRRPSASVIVPAANVGGGAGVNVNIDNSRRGLFGGLFRR